jgi:hypothetical protein
MCIITYANHYPKQGSQKQSSSKLGSEIFIIGKLSGAVKTAFMSLSALEELDAFGGVEAFSESFA